MPFRIGQSFLNAHRKQRSISLSKVMPLKLWKERGPGSCLARAKSNVLSPGARGHLVAGPVRTQAFASTRGWGTSPRQHILLQVAWLRVRVSADGNCEACGLPCPVCPALSGLAPTQALLGQWLQERVRVPLSDLPSQPLVVSTPGAPCAHGGLFRWKLQVIGS